MIFKMRKRVLLTRKDTQKNYNLILSFLRKNKISFLAKDCVEMVPEVYEMEITNIPIKKFFCILFFYSKKGINNFELSTHVGAEIFFKKDFFEIYLQSKNDFYLRIKKRRERGREIDLSLPNISEFYQEDKNKSLKLCQL